MRFEVVFQSFIEILAAMLPSFLGGGLVVFIAKNWFLERLRGGIKNEYDNKLEQLKADLVARNSKELEEIKASLTREIAVISAVQKSFGESHTAYQSHRTHAIKALWEALLYVRNNSPGIFIFVDVLLPSEYETLGEKALISYSDISQGDIMKMFGDKTKDAQDHRLFSGEYLWSLFSAYQTLNVRIALLIQSGRAKNNCIPWYTDTICKSIISSVCTHSEFEDFEQQQFGKIALIRNLIESKFLLYSNRILSGQSSSDSALEEAKRIANAVSSANQTIL